MYNLNKLMDEFKQAGIVCGGCNTDGIVWDMDNNEIQNRADVAAILLAHNPDTPMWQTIRIARDALLKSCDWTQMADSPLSSNEKEMWSAYRQLLRDIPQTYENPEDVVFPVSPGG